jgi:PleD family two-component response regulator
MAIDGRPAGERFNAGTRFNMAKILLIEDDASAHMTIVQLLEEAGHLVLWAVNGLQGMAVFRGWQPDLVITDIIMPDQEGIQTITEMRAAKPDAKIIASPAAGVSAIPISSRSHASSARWTSSRSPSIRTSCSPSWRIASWVALDDPEGQAT